MRGSYFFSNPSPQLNGLLFHFPRGGHRSPQLNEPPPLMTHLKEMSTVPVRRLSHISAPPRKPLLMSFCLNKHWENTELFLSLFSSPPYQKGVEKGLQKGPSRGGVLFWFGSLQLTILWVLTPCYIFNRTCLEKHFPHSCFTGVKEDFTAVSFWNGSGFSSNQ